jgi:hypothetical protein
VRARGVADNRSSFSNRAVGAPSLADPFPSDPSERNDLPGVGAYCGACLGIEEIQALDVGGELHPVSLADRGARREAGSGLSAVNMTWWTNLVARLASKFTIRAAERASGASVIAGCRGCAGSAVVEGTRAADRGLGEPGGGDEQRGQGEHGVVRSTA